MKCTTGERLLDGYLEESLGDEDRRRMEEHLKDCGGCADEVAAYRRTVAFLDHVALPDMGEEFWRRQRSAIVRSIAHRPVWTAPSYGIVAVVALVAGYLSVGLDWLAVSLGDFLGVPSGALHGNSYLSFDGCDTVILLYAGLVGLALLVFLSDDGGRDRAHGVRRH